MITIRIKGGLGNQLFQYAAGYALARRLNTRLTIDASFYPKQNLRGYKLDKLNIECGDVEKENSIIVNAIKGKYLNKFLRICNVRVIPIGLHKRYLLETRLRLMPYYFMAGWKNIYLDGYYQSDIYFGECRESLLKQFHPSYEAENEYVKTLKSIQTDFSVAVHVRRGDFLKARQRAGSYHYVLGQSYYQKAIKYVSEQLQEKLVFYWFSDDLEWVKQHFGNEENYRYINLHTQNADIDELMLMKNCKHIIAANSTFSWWAAWMNENPDAIRVVPQRSFGQKEMIPENWVKIGDEG